ncbi:MAG: haloacid dehalogenase-like hydrolase [Clostridia bacterium]|nr:haloacid dehalogenase-like hydrolase [Clostridia bacterium]
MNSHISELDIYDFDKTIVPFDSGSLFCVYAMLHYPKAIRNLPRMFFAAVKYLKHNDLTAMKSDIFCFIRDIPVEKAAKKFWDKYEKYIYPWAKKENRERYSVMISASPEFLIREVAGRIEIDDYFCTQHDADGKIIGINCHDREKVRLFKEKYDGTQVVSVYSDSIENDKYIFSLAKNCYHTVKGKKIPFRYEDKYKNDKI